MYLIDYKFMKAYTSGRFLSQRYILNILSASHPRQLYPERRVSAVLRTMDVSGQALEKKKLLPFPEIQCPLGRLTGRRLRSTLAVLSRLQQKRKLIWKWIFEAVVFCKDVNWSEGNSSYEVQVYT